MRVFRAAPSGGPAAVRVNRVTGYTAFGWVLVFLAWHVVWAVTGLNSPDPSDHHGAARVVATAFEVIVFVMVAVGVVLPLALVQSWGRKVPWWMLATGAWIGCVLLSARGISGVADTVVRAVGVLPDGLTGLTTEEVYGSPHPTAWARFAASATDVMFAVGGVVFGVAAVAFRRVQRTS
ncbi:hypothetical protein [Actinomadura oligospora]|uniref:hypothetical protein n=1 Tax=Actinomadura oligospora TaxID=111804 RepID=UPI0012F8CDE6|nr:hypothetical protein [Actinomadura oligospora]